MCYLDSTQLGFLKSSLLSKGLLFVNIIQCLLFVENALNQTVPGVGLVTRAIPLQPIHTKILHI